MQYSCSILYASDHCCRTASLSLLSRFPRQKEFANVVAIHASFKLLPISLFVLSLVRGREMLDVRLTRCALVIRASLSSESHLGSLRGSVHRRKAKSPVYSLPRFFFLCVINLLSCFARQRDKRVQGSVAFLRCCLSQ